MSLLRVYPEAIRYLYTRGITDLLMQLLPYLRFRCQDCTFVIFAFTAETV